MHTCNLITTATHGVQVTSIRTCDGMGIVRPHGRGNGMGNYTNKETGEKSLQRIILEM